MSTTIAPSAASSLLNTLGTTPATTTVGPQASDAQMNQFLTLLTAELKNQDPTQPTDPTQFVAQLAQFSTVEQLVQSNTQLGTISNAISGLSLGQYSGLINHTVTAAATTLNVADAGQASQMTYQVTGTGLSKMNVQITNSAGTVVRTIPVSASSGTLNFDGLDGNGQPLPAGQYGIALMGATSAGASQSAGTLSTSGTVTGVVQGSNGGWELELDSGDTVDASSVTSVL